jgi:PAS domain S-box-containing protein
MSRQPRERSANGGTPQGGSHDITERKPAEADQGSLARQRQLALDAAAMGWWHYDPVTRVTTYDKRYTEIFGVAGHERANEEILKLLHPDDLPQVWAAVEAALDPADPRPYSAEYRVNRPDGTMCWVEAHGLATFVGEGDARRATSLVGTVADITERKQAETSIREAHGRTAAILESIADALYSLDAEWRFVMVNPAAERAPFGRPASELIGKVIWDVFPKIPGTRIHQHYLDAVAKRSHEHYEAPSPLNGRWYEVFMFPRTGGLDVYLRDIDDRKKAEAALKESEERFRTIAETLPVLVSLTRTEDSVIVFTNTAYNEAFGFRKEEIIGRKGPEVYYDPADRERMIDTIKEQGFVSNYQLKAKKADGKPMWLLSSVRPIVFGGKSAILGASIDITERKQAEEALHAANLQLAEADRGKNEFLAVLSHELRNPLSPIRNSLFILERTALGGEQSKRALDVIGRQVSQLARLVDDLLDLTRVSRNKIQLQRRTLELNDLVRRTVDDHHSLFEEKGIIVEMTLAPERLPIDGDVERLAQVVGNLLHNAAKFTPTGGRVRVGTAAVPSRSRVTLRVIDTGVGIEPTMLSRLFEPFIQADATLDRSQGGLGLGLALVKGLVEMHGGGVCAHSDGPGKGAEFVVELPLDEKVGGEPSARAVGTAGSQRRVLIIEDNRDAADSLREVLQFGGHSVEVAYNGPDGLDRARGFKPEIVLCDIGLPGMDGYEVARAFRADQALKGAFLVALSGYALPDDLQRAQEAGFEKHLAKPSSLEKLEELLADARAGSPRSNSE